MSILRTKRNRSIAIGAVVALIAAAGAIAFWTSSGTGQGTASVGTDGGLAITGVSIPDTLYPGSKSAVNFTINNLSPNTAITVDKVVADSAFGATGVDGLPGSCDAGDFTFPDYTVNASIPASGSLTVNVPTASGLAFANSPTVNQDACKGAFPVLHLKAN